MRRLVRRVGLTEFAWILLVALLFVVAVCGFFVGSAHAEDGERYVPSARGTRASVVRWREVVSAYDWDVDEALRVISCESAGDADAINPYSGAAGLFQLYRWSWLAQRLFGESDVLIPWVNVATAHYLWMDSGGTFRWHWASSARCWSW